MEDLKTLVSEVETMKKVKTSLEEEIVKLQKIHNNFEAQAHTAEIKNEQDEKLKNVEVMNKYAAEESRIEQKRIAAEARIDLAETLKRNLDNRTIEVEKREQRLIDLENRIADLNSQRSNFEAYKISIEKELVEAKNIIAEADEAFEKISREKDMLMGRETKVKEQEKYWNDCIGLLEEERKKFQIEKENFIGLGKNKKEVVNV